MSLNKKCKEYPKSITKEKANDHNHWLTIEKQKDLITLSMPLERIAQKGHRFPVYQPIPKEGF